MLACKYTPGQAANGADLPNEGGTVLHVSNLQNPAKGVSLSQLAQEIRACTLCQEILEPRPMLRVHP
ncbi:MAG: hypothetical protein ACI9VR_005370, partial [Cognaticolwellia sp.]